MIILCVKCRKKPAVYIKSYRNIPELCSYCVVNRSKYIKCSGRCVYPGCNKKADYNYLAISWDFSLYCKDHFCIIDKNMVTSDIRRTFQICGDIVCRRVLDESKKYIKSF